MMQEPRKNPLDVVPLNDAQRSIWLHTLSLRRQFKDEGGMYNIGCRFVVPVPTERSSILHALEQCCSARPELLAVFDDREEALVMSAMTPAQLLCAGEDTERASSEAFSLRAGTPLVRVIVTPGEVVMILHHLLTDGFGLHSYFAPAMAAALAAAPAKSATGVARDCVHAPLSSAASATAPVLSSEVAAVVDHRAFWLAHIPPPTELVPLDMPQPDHPAIAPLPAERPTFATLRLELPMEMQRRLVVPGGKVPGPGVSVTFYSWMLGSLWALWAQYATRFDFGIGVAFANRPASPSVFSHAKVLPVYPHLLVPTSPDDAGALEAVSWLTLVHRVQQAVRAAKAHEAVRMVDLAEDRSVATQVNLVVTESQFDIFSCGSPSDLTVYLRMPPRGQASSPVVLEYLRRSDGSLSDLAVRQMHDNWMTLLQSTLDSVRSSESWRASLAWVAPNQIAELMAPNRAGDYHHASRLDDDSCFTLHGMFAASVLRYPDRVAVVESATAAAAGRQMTYAELDATSTSLACDMWQRGVRPGHRVVLLMSRSLKTMQCILAILKTGAMYVPVDAALPPARVAYIIRQAQASLVICTPKHALAVSEQTPDGTLVVQTTDEPHHRLEEAGTDSSSAEPHQLPRRDPLASAYIIFTSGSTGLPKGVEVVHRNVCNSIHALDTVGAPRAADAVLQSASLSFDMSVGQIFNAWRAGAALVLLMDVTDWEGTINRHRVSLLQIPASVLASAFDVAALPKSLRAVQIGGEALPQALARKLMQSNPHVQFSNMCGPTEGSIYSNMTILVPTWNYTPIGPPLKNQREYILNDLLQVVPPGVAGRLFMGGLAPARGYYGRPELTRERFVSDPFAEAFPPVPGEDHARMYDSGDVARWRQGSMVECLGRCDQQVKWHGLRIELGEIESCLLSCPSVSVKASAARLCPLPPGQEETHMLVGYVVLHLTAAVAPSSSSSSSSSSSASCEAELRAHLERHLPTYMVPSQILTIDALPVSSSGKLERGRLPAPPPPALQLPAAQPLARVTSSSAAAAARARRRSSGEKLLSPSTRQQQQGPGGQQQHSPTLSPAPVAPTNPEQLLRAAWVDALPQLASRPDTDWADLHFFHCGGTSLSLVKLLRLIRASFPQATFTAADLFARPTFPEMLRLLASRHGRKLSKLPQIQEQSRVLAPSDPLREPVHIIGMAGTFPGAASVGEFWKLLCSQAVVTKETAPVDRTCGVRTAAGRLLQDPFEFDAEAFGIRAEEATLMDPQHRIALQQTLDALDDAGIVPRALAAQDLAVGVYTCASSSMYWDEVVCPKVKAESDQMSGYTARINNGVDQLATRIAFHFHCTGPALAVQTACSSSLSTVSVAVDHLRLGRCDVALVVASSLRLPGHDGYTYQPGMIFSESGRCRPFEQRADGTVPGSAAVVLVLTRANMLAALGPLTRTYAVIDAVAVGNNGRQPAEPGSSVAKHATFSTPTVQGQVRVLRQALRQAGILETAPELVRYVESHGTGTAVGDAVEWSTLHDVFTPSIATTWVGSAKANVGHTDAASGLVGLVKTALILFHNRIPDQPDFERMHEALLASSCLRVAAATSEPREDDAARPFEAFCDQPPRYACVQSIGMGGTNTSAVLRRFVAPPPAAVPAATTRAGAGDAASRLATPSILLKASSPEQGVMMRDRVQQAWSEIEPPERRVWSQESWRRELAPRGVASIVLSHATPRREFRCVLPQHPDFVVLEQGASPSSVLVLCAGQGGFDWRDLCQQLRESDRMSHQMTADVACLQRLYDQAPEAFRREVPPPCDVWQHTQAAALPAALDAWQPCLTASLQLCQWQAWCSHVTAHSAAPSNRPATALGHSLGEYAAACISGALTSEQMLQLLFFRMLCLHRFAHLHTGAMLLVHASAERAVELSRRHVPECFLACRNSATHTVLCGRREQVARLEAVLDAQPTPVRWKRLASMNVSYHAPEVYFGTDMKQLWFREWPLAGQHQEAAAPLSSPSLHATPRPGIRFVSCLADHDVAVEQLRTAEHWWRHLTSPVCFDSAVARQLDHTHGTVLALELGQGRGLASLARFNNPKNAPLRHIEPRTAERAWMVGMQLHVDAVLDGRPSTLHDPAAIQLPSGSALSRGSLPSLTCDPIASTFVAAPSTRSAAVVPRLSLREAISEVASGTFRLSERAPWTTELFRELGNDSLQVVTFLHKLAETTGHTIPRHLLRPEHVYAHPTLRAFEAWLAPHVRSRTAAACWTDCFETPGGPEQHLIVLVPPAGGTLHLLDDVVRSLTAQLAGTAGGPGVRCIGLHRPMEIGLEATRSVENLATYFNGLVQEFIAAQPRAAFDRITLVGASFGGMVAFDMLRQWPPVTASTAPSAFRLVMLDTPSKRTFRLPRDDLVFIIWWMLQARFSLTWDTLKTIPDLEAARVYLTQSHSHIRTMEEWNTCVQHARIMHEDVASLKSFDIERARLDAPPAQNCRLTCTLIECDQPNAALGDAVGTAQDWRGAFGDYCDPCPVKAPGSHLGMFAGAGAGILAAQVLRISSTQQNRRSNIQNA
jgi:amino acid adenylation domain-containing protein